MERDLGEAFAGDVVVLTVPEFDFHSPPKSFSPIYIFGQRVTRDNFSAFIVDGFRRSQGVSAAHRDIVTFLDSRVDTRGILDTCRHFLSAGGWNVLNFEEQRYIFENYSRVKHKSRIEEMGIDLFGEHLIEEFSSVLSPIVPDSLRFDGMTIEEFLKMNREFVVAEKNARAQIQEGNLNDILRRSI